jgi:hypothetical protein
MTGWTIAMLAVADLEGSAMEVAVRVIDVLAGMVVGGVYVFEVLSGVEVAVKDPHAGEQGDPPCVRVQVSPTFAESFCTMEVNCCVRFKATFAEVGLRVMET